MKILFAKFALKQKNDCVIFLHTSSISQSVQFFLLYGHKLCNFSPTLNILQVLRCLEWQNLQYWLTLSYSNYTGTLKHLWHSIVISYLLTDMVFYPKECAPRVHYAS
jgi:hypothetical protein